MYHNIFPYNLTGINAIFCCCRPEDIPIILPSGYDPLALLNQVEGLYHFSSAQGALIETMHNVSI